MKRIEQYLDNFGRVAFLREVDGDLNPSPQDAIVVLAREYDENNRVSRAWFLATQGRHADGVGVTKIPHRVVAVPIVPGEPSKPADPTASGSGGFSEEVLVKIKQQQVKQANDLQHFTTYSREWHKKDATIAEQGKRIEQLEAELLQADTSTRELSERAAGLATKLQQARVDLAALREEKSLSHRVWVWFQRHDRSVSNGN